MKIFTKLKLLAFAAILMGLCSFDSLSQGVTPGPEHEVLKKFEGTWSAKSQDSGDEMGVLTAKMELGGLWLITTFKGQINGQSFDGRGMDSYDPKKKQYVSVWADSMSTAPMVSKGSYDKEKKTLTMTGEGPGPDGQMLKFRSTTKFESDDRHVFAMYMTTPDGQEMKILDLVYTRKK